MQNLPIAHLKIRRASIHQLLDVEDELVVEEPLEIQLLFGAKGNLSSKVVSVTMRTPGNDEELAPGFLFTEGIINHQGQVERVGLIAENKVLVVLREGVTPILQNAERNFYATSSCGVCGKTGIEAIKTVSLYNNIKDDIHLVPGLFYELEPELRKQQELFESTGGLHASALFDLEGKFILLREDVGRHNALDKLIGHAFLNNLLPLQNNILLLSGRAGFELIQKAAMAGIKIVAAVGAPSSLAVQLAEEAGITLLGFLRNKGFNIYTGAHRIVAGKCQ
jgi:FdhD protein